MDNYKYDICVVGGGGHVGLPLSILLSDAGFSTCIYDINQSTLETIKKGELPFKEAGAEELLKKNIGKNLSTSNDPVVISASKFVFIIIGTPVDEHLNPEFNVMIKLLNELLPFFRDGQYVVLRSTVYPGSTERVKNYFARHGLKINLAFCPERIAEGKAMSETKILPQIISAFDKDAENEIKDLFSKIVDEVVILSPLEAELAKLFTNSWRYIEFAAANQFYSVASKFGVDFYNIYNAITYHYPRAAHFAKAGFAAGPCLFKDTMQIAALNNNDFPLGIAAMLVNEGLPNVIVNNLKEVCDLSRSTVGILGMAFKGDSDDKRESLAYKLKKMLEMDCPSVLCSDVFIKDPGFISSEELVAKSDIIILGCTHSSYKDFVFPANKKIIDVWNFLNK